MVEETKNDRRDTLRIGWFTTANGPGSRGMFTAVLDAIRNGTLNAEFEFVFINRERGQTVPTDSFINLAENHDIPTITLSSREFRGQHGNAPWSQLREPYDREVLSKLASFKPDISVMAGYMLFAPEISRQMLILNQHPALPGGTIGKWQDANWDVIEDGRDRHGVMMHIATPELDRGPVVSTCSFPVRGPQFDALWKDTRNQDIAYLRKSGDESLPLFAAIRQAGLIRERPLVVATLKAIDDHEIDLGDLRAEHPIEPLDMTDRIERELSLVP